MTQRIARSPIPFLVPFLLAACGPGDSDPQGARTVSAISFGGETFQEPPGSVLGCQVAFCMEGVGCHVCAGEAGGCAPQVGCLAPDQTVMGPGDLCSQDGCIPSGCFPAFCTAAGLCTVCDDGDPSTIDQCFNDPASPCRHVPIDGPDAIDDAVGGSDLAPGVDLPGAVDVVPAEDVPAIPDASVPEDAASPGDTGPGPGCVEECLKTCVDDDGECDKNKHPMGEDTPLPPGWRKGKHRHCDNGRHLGFEKGRHEGWGKDRHGDQDGKDEGAPDVGPSCEEICQTTCAGDDKEEDPDGGKTCGKHDGDGPGHSVWAHGHPRPQGLHK